MQKFLDIELHIAAALLNVTDQHRRAYAGRDWQKEEAAVLEMSKAVADAVRDNFCEEYRMSKVS